MNVYKVVVTGVAYIRASSEEVAIQAAIREVDNDTRVLNIVDCYAAYSLTNEEAKGLDVYREDK